MSSPADDSSPHASEFLKLLQVKHVVGPDDWDEITRILPEFPEALFIEGRLSVFLGPLPLTIAIEGQYIDKDYRDTFAGYFSKRFHTPSSRCVRLHFFHGKVAEKQILSGRLPLRTRYLGYSVLRPLDTGGLGRTLLDMEMLKAGDGEHWHARSCREKVNILGVDYEVRGFPYIGQDTEVAVCAQASLWMIMRYFSNAHPNYREVGPHELGHLVSDFSVGRVFPSAGLNIWQTSEVLRRIGFHPVIHHRKSFKEKGSRLANKIGFHCADRGFEHLFYTYIESGIPLLVAFEDHAVVAFGHASNYQEKLDPQDASRDNFFHSSAWNRRFLIHDDAKLPYQFMELGDDGTERCFGRVESFVAPMPDKTFLPAEEFLRLVREFLRSEDFGTKRKSPNLAQAIDDKKIALRSFLATGKDLKRSLLSRGMPPVAEEAYRYFSLPHFIWISEIHEIANYPERCIGQIVWDATSSSNNLHGFLFAHYPELLMMNTTAHFNRPNGTQWEDVQELALRPEVDGFTTFRSFDLNLPPKSPSHGKSK